MALSIVARHHVPPARSGERGSALVVTLLALLILSVVGIALAYVTQNEALLGSNERTIERVFYAADSGIAVGTARVLWHNDHAATTFSYDETRAVSGADLIQLHDQVSVTRVLPIADSPCDLCQINNGAAYFRIQHALTSTALRTGTTGDQDPDDAVPLAQSRVSVVLGIQPWQRSPAALASSAEELAQVKF